MRVAVHFSGDIESVYALEQCALKQWEVSCLFRPMSRYADSPFACVNRGVVEFAAEAVGIPLDVIELSDRELFDLEGYLGTLKERGVEGVVFGRLQRLAHVQLESLCSRVGMRFIVLAKQEQRMGLLTALVQKGYAVILTSIQNGPSSLLGLTLDPDTLKELANAKPRAYETVVLDGPLYRKALEVSVGYPEVKDEGNGVYHICQVNLGRK